MTHFKSGTGSTASNAPEATGSNAHAGNKPLVAVLAGGFSAEYAISVQSGREVWQSLLDSPFEPVLVHVQPGIWTAGDAAAPVDLSEFSIPYGTGRRRFDAAFVALHGRPGENGELAGYLEMLGIPHTTCDVRAAVLTFDKALCKEKVAGTGVTLARGVLLNSMTRQSKSPASLPGAPWTFPLFVKPNRNGSSCGISKVRNAADLQQALEHGWTYDQELLVEEGIEGGREVTCAVFSRDGELQTLPLCEIVSGKGHDFFDYTAKYTAGEAEEIVPAPISAEEESRVIACSKAIYRQLDCRGLVRIDYILQGGHCWFLEVNTVPGMSQASIVPKMVRSLGQTTGQFFAALIQEAMAHPILQPVLSHA
ncbi:MAG: D-alanine--D-alanine ligase [Bacteroidetes bacterium]|nr:D-alanine--D-alanine ligase [Bacteroidota bacterium]